MNTSGYDALTSFCAGLICVISTILFFVWLFSNNKYIKPSNSIIIPAKMSEEERLKQEEKKKIMNGAIRRQEEEVRKQDIEKKILIDRTSLQFIQAIQLCADEKPCPRCNELEVIIHSLSPNARSMVVICKNCAFEYRIKMEPSNSKEIIELFNLFSYSCETSIAYKHYNIFWRMEINKRQQNFRGSIPSEIKKAVWKRDGGKCVKCGSTMELQYDHIIPVSKGGSSTIANIQILCKTCNLKKHASIE